MTPCSAKHGKFCSPAHRLSMEEYWVARAADVAAMEYETVMHRTEVAEYKATHNMITFKKWLEGGRSAHLTGPEGEPDPGDWEGVA